LSLAVAAAACGGGGSDTDIESAPASTAPAPVAGPSTTVASTGPVTELTLRVTDVRLVNSEESDSGMRVLLPAGVANAIVTLTGVPNPNRVISVCQARELDRRMSSAACRTPASGEPVTVALGSAATGVEIVQVGTAGAGPAGNSVALDEVNIRYSASSREVNTRLSQISAGESGGAPTFSLSPPSANGAYRAKLTWTVIQTFGGSPSNGQLELVQAGSAGSQAQSGASGVELTGNVSPPAADVAVRVKNTGSSAMVAPTLAALLP
jgi:hypothetical protein